MNSRNFKYKKKEEEYSLKQTKKYREKTEIISSPFTWYCDRTNSHVHVLFHVPVHVPAHCDRYSNHHVRDPAPCRALQIEDDVEAKVE